MQSELVVVPYQSASFDTRPKEPGDVSVAPPWLCLRVQYNVDSAIEDGGNGN